VTSPTSSNGLMVSRLNGMPVSWNPNGCTGHVEVVVASGTVQPRRYRVGPFLEWQRCGILLPARRYGAWLPCLSGLRVWM